MKKSKSCGKILLACMAVSYLQLAGSVGLVFAEDLVPVEPLVVEDTVILPVEPEALPDEPEMSLPDVPAVEVVAADGVLSYEIMVEGEDSEIPPVGYRAEWWSSVVTEDGTETEEMVSEESTYTPETSGDYEVRVWSVDSEGGDSSEYGSDEYEVLFPAFDESQLVDLTFRAGEVFFLEYTDEFGFADLTAASGDEILVVAFDEDVWTAEGSELTIGGDYDLVLAATSTDGFQSVYVVQYSVDAGVVNSVYSTLSVTMSGEEVEYVEVDSGDLDVVFTAYDSYQNEVDTESLDSVRVRLNGEMLEGTDYVGASKYTVERTAKVPEEENLKSEVVVDVFSEECEGELAGELGYCFSKISNFVVYDTDVAAVTDLKYIARTNESSVIISGTKVSGYGVKINSLGSEYVVSPNDATTFSFEMPLAEGLNRVEVYAVKVVSEELVFYSDSTVAIIQKDSVVSSPIWRSTAITLDGNNQATLHWIDPIYLTDTDYDFTHVNIYRSTVPNFVPSKDNLVVQTHNPSWTDTGLTASTAYYYAIEAVDSLGNTAMINTVESTGDILGEAATVAVEQVWYEDLFAGKGEYDENEESLNGEGAVDFLEDAEGKGEDEGFVNKMSELFNKAKTGTSTFAKKVFNNIFVQIILGGVVIFLGLMTLISVLVWLKERVVSSSLSLEEVDSAIKKGKKVRSKGAKKPSKKRTSKSKKPAKKRKRK